MALCLISLTVSASALPKAAKYYIKSAETGKYVVLQNANLADISGSKEDANLLSVLYMLKGNDEGLIKELKNTEGEGDMIATLNLIKSSFKEVLEDEEMATDFLDQMFTMLLVPAGDGAVYLCVDIPEIEDFDNVREYLIQTSGGNTAVNFYLSHMEAGKRHYLTVDPDDSFGFSTDNSGDCKWVLEMPEAQSNLPENGDYRIKNVSTGKYVCLVNSLLAEVTATEDEADVIFLNYDKQPNGEGIVTRLNNSKGEGDMIATLNLIKSSFQEVLDDEEMPTNFLDEMFTLNLVATGDRDVSAPVYLCVDIPDIENFDEIRNYLQASSGGQQAVNFYLSHMEPGKRHYLTVDYDDSFGFTTNPSATAKWVLEMADTGVNDIDTNKTVTKVTYLNMMGIESATPFDGVNIVVTNYDDGSARITKALK
ncbi:MAG: hypothetical protein J6X70_06560 [Muribaculaceae bacterium]|nr:hypothetical protein [Muribaculaceae bacterium]